MTYLSGPSIRPQAGGFYQLRAGLECLIVAPVDFYGVLHWRGYLLPPSSGVILWHTNGHYSPTRDAHELDIVAEAP